MIQTIKQDDVTIRSLLLAGQPVLTYTRGVSMLPLIRQGKSYVSLVPVDGEPRVGDVVAFSRRSDNVNILHRLVEITDDVPPVYITRGDNCLACERMHRQEIFGRMEHIYWTSQACSLVPMLLGAQREADGGYNLSADAPGHRRYTRLWQRTWPARRVAFRARAYARSAAKRVLKVLGLRK